MKIIDISMEIHNSMMVYKNKTENRPALEHTRIIPTDKVNESVLHINLHTGTHMDAPRHTVISGNTIEQTDLSRCLTRCNVFDFTHIENCITRDDLVQKNIRFNDFVILKTQNSYSDGFEFNFIYLEKSGAEYLRELGVKGVGIDCLGIERDQPDHASHNALLSDDIVILEGLRLKDVAEGEYFLSALPLKITDGNGSPVRAVLFTM